MEPYKRIIVPKIRGGDEIHMHKSVFARWMSFSSAHNVVHTGGVDSFGSSCRLGHSPLWVLLAFASPLWVPC